MDELERQRELFERAMDDISRNVIATADTFDDLNKSTNKYTKSLDALDKFTNTYGRQIKNLGRDFDQNKGKMSAFSGITDLAGDALGELGVAGRLAGKALSAIAGMTFEEVDRTMENFQKMGSVGAVGAEGMTEFRIGAHAARLTMDQFANIIAKNSNALALATGNTLDGARAISQVTKAAGDTGLRRQLLNLGVGIEEQTDFFADYFAQVRRLGLQQNRDFRSQTSAVGTYVKQLILLSRLTGESIDGARAQLEAQQRSARFEGAMQALAQQFGPEYANRIAAEVGALGNKLGPAGQSMLMDIFAGPNTQAAKDFLITFGSEGQAAIDRVKSGAADLGELSEMIVRSGMAQRERFGGPGQLALLAETGAIDATVSALLSVPKATELTVESLRKQMDAINAGAIGADELTNNLNKAAIASQNAAVNLESARDIFINLGSTVLPAFSGAVEGATNMLKGLVHGLGGGLPRARAAGGPVTGGQPYLVGEEGPEIFSPGASGQITNADITSRLAAIAQGSQLTDSGAGTVSFVEGLKQTFMPGIGNVAQYSTGNVKRTIIETLEGALEEYTSYAIPGGGLTASIAKIGDQMYGDARFQIGSSGYSSFGTIPALDMQTGYQQLGGPKSYYDSMMSGVNPLKDATIHKNVGGEVIKQASNDNLLQMQEAMLGVLNQIAQSTKTGADTSKQLLRSTAG